MKHANSEVFINGPDGKLEAKYIQSKRENAPIALILHPHPEYGGTMNNKVVYNTSVSYTHLTLPTICSV